MKNKQHILIDEETHIKLKNFCEKRFGLSRGLLGVTVTNIINEWLLQQEEASDKYIYVFSNGKKADTNNDK